MMGRVVLAIAVAVFAAGAPAYAAVDAGALCKEAKAKAAGKKAFDLLKAFGKNVRNPEDAKLAQDISKAGSKFTKGFTKAEGRGGCPTSGGSDAIEAKVDLFGCQIVESVGPATCGNNCAGVGEECDGTDDAACPGSCVGPGDFCGDNVRNGGVPCTCATEECDGTDDAACPGRCMPAGSGGGICGDNVRNGGLECTCAPEDCDGADDAACPGRCIPAGGLGGFCGDNTINDGDECTCLREDCDGTNDAACPGICQANCRCPEPLCGNGKLEVGEECEPPCSEDPPCGSGTICGATCTCVEKEPCNCGSPQPDLLDFIPEITNTLTEQMEGSCGEVRDASDVVLTDLDCAKLYLGGGLPGISLIADIPLGKSINKVQCCYGTTLVLGNTTDYETGDLQTCTSTADDIVDACTFGGPEPIIITTGWGIHMTACSVNYIEVDSHGYMDCSTGEGMIRYPFLTKTYWNTEESFNYEALPRRCKVDPEGYYKDYMGRLCDQDDDCPQPEGKCLPDDYQQPCPICNPVTLKCNGGRSDGLDCTPQNLEWNAAYPTSQDCLPDRARTMEFVTHQPYALKTGETTMQADEDGNFCGYCRDMKGGSSCFEGDPAGDCPDSAVIPNCKPASGIIDGCGPLAMIPCGKDADCYGPYGTCVQLVRGAFDCPPARKITMQGLPAEGISDGAQHPVILSGAFCSPLSSDPSADLALSLPGPGAVSLPGKLQLR